MLSANIGHLAGYSAECLRSDLFASKNIIHVSIKNCNIFFVQNVLICLNKSKKIWENKNKTDKLKEDYR